MPLYRPVKHADRFSTGFAGPLCRLPVPRAQSLNAIASTDTRLDDQGLAWHQEAELLAVRGLEPGHHVPPIRAERHDERGVGAFVLEVGGAAPRAPGSGETLARSGLSRASVASFFGSVSKAAASCSFSFESLLAHRGLVGEPHAVRRPAPRRRDE